jgi:hypothetical protein
VVLIHVKHSNLPPTAIPAMVPTWDDLEDEDEEDWLDEGDAADDVLMVEEVIIMEAVDEALVVGRGAVDSGLSAAGHG